MAVSIPRNTTFLSACSFSGRRISAESDGVKVSELKAEIAMENAIVSENCWYSKPVVPGKNATGTNTATSTSDVAMTAPVTSPMASDAAKWESTCSSPICLWMFSITTIASSTTSPVASTMPNSVKVLMENPSNLINANVPIRETGIVTAGISVLRQSCRNRNITIITKMTASTSVFNTSLIESPTNVVESNAMAYFKPGGKRCESRTNSALTALSTSSALAVGSCEMPMPTPSYPLNRSFPA